MTKRGDLILWVAALSDDRVPHAGAKIARLGELKRCGNVTVPDGFAVTTEAFDRFLTATRAGDQIDELFRSLERSGDRSWDRSRVSEVSAKAREIVETATIPDEIAEAIVDAYEELSYRKRDLNIPVAVRSSATGEDAADASFAGQFDTYLGVTGPRRVLEAVRRCWGSSFTERAVDYRRQKKLDYRDSPMAVGVLQLVHASASGVAFSIHPVTGNRHRMVIEGSWGWGEAVVQGLVTPDHIEIGKSDGRILEYEVADKKVVSAFDYAQGQVVQRDMPSRLRKEKILRDEEIRAIVDAVLSIEKKYGYPVDVEWVLDRHRRSGEPMTIVQTRPVTVRAAPDQDTVPKWNPVAYAQKYAFGSKR